MVTLRLGFAVGVACTLPDTSVLLIEKELERYQS